MAQRSDPSEWQVEMVISGGKKFYRVFRIKDPDQGDSSKNRETRGGRYEKYIDADRLRKVMNTDETKHEHSRHRQGRP